jgi:hypothetical protein
MLLIKGQRVVLLQPILSAMTSAKIGSSGLFKNKYCCKTFMQGTGHKCNALYDVVGVLG